MESDIRIIRCHDFERDRPKVASYPRRGSARHTEAERAQMMEWVRQGVKAKRELRAAQLAERQAQGSVPSPGR